MTTTIRRIGFSAFSHSFLNVKVPKIQLIRPTGYWRHLLVWNYSSSVAKASFRFELINIWGGDDRSSSELIQGNDRI